MTATVYSIVVGLAFGLAGLAVVQAIAPPPHVVAVKLSASAGVGLAAIAAPLTVDLGGQR